MKIDLLRPFVPKPRLLFPRNGLNGKQFAMVHFSENSSFFESYRSMKIKPAEIRNLMVPTTKKPLTRLTPALRKIAVAHKLRPIRMDFGSYERFSDINYYMDMNVFFGAASERWKFKRFNTGRAAKFTSSLINTADGIPADTHHKVLLYTINLNKPIADKLFFKRSYPFYRALQDGTFPYDYWLLFYYNEEESRFVKLWDRNMKIPLPRVKNYLMKMKPQNPDLFVQEKDDEISDEVVKEVPTNREEVKSAVKTYLKMDPRLRDDETPDASDVAAKAVVYHITGDVDKAKRITQTTSKAENKKIVKKYSGQLLKKDPVNIVTTDKIIRMANVPKQIENNIPTHIINKRHRDFDENLRDDLNNVFKILEKKQVPLKIKSIKKTLEKTPVSELKPTLKDRYTINLIDPEGKAHEVYIDLPHLTENGTFLINGRNRVLVNQMITYPIFFFKPYYGQLTTVYSALTIHSKQIKRGAYLMGFMGGYKVPLILLLMYKVGFFQTLKLFGLKYQVVGTKPEEVDGQTFVKISDQEWAVFTSESEEGAQLIRGLTYSTAYWPKSYKADDIKTPAFWRKVLVNFTGTRNAIYIIDEVWKNIITPIEVEVLMSHGDPTTLPEIIKFITSNVVQGKVDDRNALEKQRVRTSEVFTALILKQMNAAYNEYLSKRLGGDEEATFQLNPTRAFSEVITSQNVQLLENINPVEEISMMTRVTPIGVGGIPDKRAITNVAMNIHDSYYGNIDPLETPDGPSVGILQHLTVDASIINKRGQFGIKDHSKVHGGEILSSTPSLIPFAESCEGARIVMSSGQMKQAIPLLHPEAAAVTTGYDAALTSLLSSDFIKKTKNGGTVTEVSKDIIKIKGANGRIETISTEPRLLNSGQGRNGISVFKPVVKVGQKVKAGQILAEGGGVQDGQIATGVHMLCALMPWKGYNFEDAVVISESAAKKFTSVHIEEEKVYIEPDEDVVFITDEGDVVKKGGIALTYSSAVYDVESYRHLRLEGGTIMSIEVYANTDEIPEKLIPAFERFKKRFIDLNKKYPQGVFKEKTEKFEGIMIKFIIRHDSPLVKGDKLNNRHYNKGVVSIIEPDDNMPITPWGERVELILNPLSVINRMNSSQIVEMYAGLISWKLGQIMQTKSRTQFLATFKKVMTLLDGTKDKEMSKNMIQKMTSVSDAAYQTLVKEVGAKRFIPMIFPPFKTPDRRQFNKALAAVDLEPRFPLDIPGMGKTKETVMVGYLYETKLEHMSEKKLASRSVGGYVSKTMAPTQGKKRGGGQKVGENDMYALLSWDCPILVEEFFGALSSDHVTKNEIIAEIIHGGSGEFKMPKTNPVRDLYSQMMLAIHLQSE